jgi:hypothetical protein
MNPERIAQALHGRRSGRGWSARCPLHDDRHASLSLWIDTHGRLGVFCHAGCPWPELVTHLKAHGLWSEERLDPAGALATAEAYQRQQREEARRIWRETVPLALTPGEHYLAHWRAILLPPPPRLRWHWGRFVLVALVTDPLTDHATGVQLTPLDRLTNRRAGNRQFVGRSGVVRLLEGPGELVLGEGLETTLSGTEIVGAKAAWAALSATGLASLRLPASFREVGLLVDRDAAGETACRKAAARLTRADPRRAIRFLRPALPHNDFNDVLRAMRGGSHG